MQKTNLMFQIEDTAQKKLTRLIKIINFCARVTGVGSKHSGNLYMVFCKDHSGAHFEPCELFQSLAFYLQRKSIFFQFGSILSSHNRSKLHNSAEKGISPIFTLMRESTVLKQPGKQTSSRSKIHVITTLMKWRTYKYFYSLVP